MLGSQGPYSEAQSLDLSRSGKNEKTKKNKKKQTKKTKKTSGVPSGSQRSSGGRLPENVTEKIL